MATSTARIKDEGYRVGGQLNIAKGVGLLTDARVVAAGVKQVERMTVVGSVGGGGGGTLIVNVKTGPKGPAALYNGGAGKNIEVTVANSDTASQSATKIRSALDGDADVAAYFAAAGGSSANVDMTTETAIDEDTQMNISYTLGTATGPTPVTASSTETAGQSIGDLAEDVLGFTISAKGVGYKVRTDTAAALIRGREIGLLTDSAITDLTTIDALIALTNVPAGYGNRAFYD